MDIVFIGSIAKHHRLDSSTKEHDIDIIASYEDTIKFIKRYPDVYSICPSSKGRKLIAKTKVFPIEAEITWDNSNAKELFDLIVSDENTDVVSHGYINYYFPSIHVLYMIKMSHRFLRNSPFFQKTMDDIILMRNHGATFDSRYLDWYKKRERETYYYKHPSLDKTSKEFFDSSVNYVYNHDDIHQAVKLYDRPAYTYFMKDDEEVMVDMDKFFTLPYNIQLASVVEESMVLALERHQIPNEFRPYPYESFYMALEKVCTSITSGRWREFAYDHYYDAAVVFESECMLDDDNYVDRFKKSLSLGKIRLHNS